MPRRDTGPAVVSPLDAGPLPGAATQYLTDPSQQELDALRGVLDARLAALEAALANPHESEALEPLVVALARVATTEADATATRLCRQARLEAQTEVAAVKAGAEKQLQLERSAAATARSSVEKASADLEAERRTTVRLRRELDQARTVVETARAEEVRLRREFQQSQVALGAERAAGERLVRALDETRALLGAERAAAATLRGALDEAEQRSVASEREKTDEIRAIQTRVEHDRGQEQASAERVTEQLAARERDLDEAHRLADARRVELENARQTAAAYQAELDAARRGAEAQREELEAARATARARQDDLDAAATELDGLEAHYAATEKDRAALEQAWREAMAQGEATMRERDELARELRELTRIAEASAADGQAQSTRTATELAETVRAWRDAEARAGAAVRVLETRSAELHAEREMALTAGARHEETREALEQRIAELTQQLADLTVVPVAPVESPEAEVVISLDELAVADPRLPAMPAVDAPPWPVEQPTRAASRHAFERAVDVLIDGGSAALVDLSTTGAQVISPTPLKPNRVVKLHVPSDTTPVACRGKIVWARLEAPASGGPLSYRAGVCFMDVDVAVVAEFLARRPGSQ